MQPSYALSRERRRNREAAEAKKASSEKAAIELSMAQTPEEAVAAVKDAEIAGMVGNEIVRQYPGHGWQVVSDIQNGIVKIYNAHISGQIGWIWKMDEMNPGTFERDIRRIGGEMLERSGLSRTVFSEDEVMEIQRTINGEARIDLS
jgi:hypothetical protein